MKVPFSEQGRPPIYECSDAQKCFGRMERRRKAREARDPTPKPVKDLIVHYLQYGQTPCLMPTPPGSWPERHKWSAEWPEVTCKDCLRGKDTIVPTFTISTDGKSITCLRCQRTSYNQNDVDNHYCGACHVFHDDIWPPARKWWVENVDPRMPYANAFAAFTKALDDMVVAERNLTVVTVTEPVRERARLARVRAMGLYNDLLTQLQQAGIEPICRESEAKS